MKYILALSLCVVTSLAQAQSSNLGQRWSAGSTFRGDSGNTIKINSIRASVSGGSCVIVQKNVDTGTGYQMTNTMTLAASPKDGGHLCSGGTWLTVGADGRQFSGNSSANLFIKAGAVYSVRR